MGAGVQTDHQFHIAELLTENVEVGLEIRGARFLRCFDENDATGVWNAIAFEFLNGEEGREHGVPVVGDAASEESIALPNWSIGVEAV